MQPFTEKPLPSNIPQPPQGWYFIGFDEELPRSDCKELMAVFYMIATDSWTRSDWLNRKPSRNFAIAAPEHLVNRLPSPESIKSWSYPLFEHMSKEHDLTLTETELSDIVQVSRRLIDAAVKAPESEKVWRVLVGGNLVLDDSPMTVDAAHAEAERRADMPPYVPVYVVRIAAKYAAQTVIKKEEY